MVLIVGGLIAHHGSGQGSGQDQSQDEPALSDVATASVKEVPVYAAPGGAVAHTLANPDTYGEPLTFLVTHRQDPWLQVALPIRPNGSTGWVRMDQVRVQTDPYRLDVALKAHELRLFRDGALTGTYPIGVGTQQTPTPGGVYYLRVLIKPDNPGGAYGPFAYGLNGFSQVLNDFAGGDGVIGLHGTNEPAAIGHDVSHGCIRLHNEDISALAKLLPLGTPVRIFA